MQASRRTLLIAGLVSALNGLAMANEHGASGGTHEAKPAHEGGEHAAKAEHEAGEGEHDEHGAASSAHERALPVRPARTSSRDVKIPRALVARIEREYKEHLAKLKLEANAKDGIKRHLLNLGVELTAERAGALSEDVRVSTPTGGGVIDMAEFVTPLRGAFHARFVVKQEAQERPTTSRVFFVSQAKSRILGGEEYGAGCGKFMEITTRYNKKFSSKGFDLYSTDQRYLSVLGGTFVFVDYQPEALFVGSLTFTDSRYPNLLCEGT